MNRNTWKDKGGSEATIWMALRSDRTLTRRNPPVRDAPEYVAGRPSPVLPFTCFRTEPLELLLLCGLPVMGWD